MWGRDDNSKEAHKHLSDEEVYKAKTNDPYCLERTIFTDTETLEYFFNKDTKFADFICC